MEWNALLVLGAYHGINPGMGWLFAVALGMQQGNVRGVVGALPPIALGHAVAVGVVVLAAALAGLVVPLDTLKIVVASILMMLGLYRLWRHRHPRFGGMQVGFFDLTVWSFLMASAHGAGFMVLPFVLGVPAVAGQRACRAHGHKRYRRALDQCDGGWHPYAGVSNRDGRCGVRGVPKAGSQAPTHGVDQPGLAVGRRAGDHRRRRAADIADASMLAAGRRRCRDRHSTLFASRALRDPQTVSYT